MLLLLLATLHGLVCIRFYGSNPTLFFKGFYYCFPLLTRIYQCLSLFTLAGLHMFTHVYLCLHLFTNVYPCLLLYTYVHSCYLYLPLFTRVYLVYHYLYITGLKAMNKENYFIALNKVLTFLYRLVLVTRSSDSPLLSYSHSPVALH